MSSHRRAFFRSTLLFSFLSIILLVFTLLTPGDIIYQSYSSHRLGNIFVVSGVYIFTLLVVLLIYASRIFTNRGVLAGIPKPWIPIEAGDVGKSARRFILDGLNESSIIAHQVRPRNRSEEDISRANPNPVIPKDDAPRWGLISHLGWIVPGDLDISHLEIEPIIRELPHILEARALSLAPTCQQVVQTTRNVSDHLPDNYIVDLLQRQQNMGLREYLNYLRRLNVIESSHRIHDFIRLYDRSRYSTRPLNEAEFQEMMSLFAEVLEGITTIFDTDITTSQISNNCGEDESISRQSSLSRNGMMSSSSSASFVSVFELEKRLQLSHHSSTNLSFKGGFRLESRN